MLANRGREACHQFQTESQLGRPSYGQRGENIDLTVYGTDISLFVVCQVFIKSDYL